MTTIKAKICGLTSREAVLAACDAGAAYTGFVFYPKSPRHITADRAAELAGLVAEPVRKVGVFVDPDDDGLDAVLSRVPLDFIQLHGAESPARVQDIRSRFKRPVIKAIAISGPDDITRAHDYETMADMLLFDAKAPHALKDALPGGNGLSFDWRLINATDWTLPWLLSGGLNTDNILQAIAATGAKFIDVSSGVESRPGQKDSAKITAFMRCLT